MLNNLEPTDRSLLSENLNALINASLEEENNKQAPREYLGGSRVGVECSRALFYEYKNHTKDPDKNFTGKVIRRFRMGHMHEIETAAWLRSAGFTLLTEKADGSQFGFNIGKGRIRGHIDGVLTAGPDIGVPYNILWEHKIMKNSKFNECVKHGVQKANFVYFAQTQMYMAYMPPVLNFPVNHTLFTALNTDTSELYFELVAYNPQIAQNLSDRAARIVMSASASELPRITKDKNDYRCKFCSYYDTCWERDAALQLPTFVG